MSLLLDTHVWVWWLTGQSDLPVRERNALDKLARRCLRSPRHEVFLSHLAASNVFCLRLADFPLRGREREKVF